MTYSFINFDPNASSREKGLELSRICSHAGKMVWLTKRKRLARKSSYVLDTAPHSPYQETQQLDGRNVEQPSVDSMVGSMGNPHPTSSGPKSTVFGKKKGQVYRLDAVRLNPFSTLPLDLSQEFIAKSNAYSLSIIWPNLTPGAASRGIPCAATQGWLPLMMEYPAACCAMLYGSFSHRLVTKRNAGLRTSELEYIQGLKAECQTIQYINNALSREAPGHLANEAIILSVLCLATNARDETAWLSRRVSPFNAPLKMLQSLDVYGTLKLHPVHAKGLVRLIRLHGGLNRISTPGLAATISYSGIIEAVRSLERPVFPYIPLVAGGAARSLRCSFDLDHDVSEGEFDFNRLCASGLTSELVDVLRAMRAFETTISAYSDGSVVHLDVPLICDQRNLIMHTLMSLPSAAISPDSEATACTYATTKLAVTLYGIGVIFPLPASSAPFKLLVRKLLAALQAEDATHCHISQLSQLKLWILTIAGIASEASMPVERSYFIMLIQQMLPGKLRFQNFMDYKYMVLKPIIWLDIACDAAGERLWKEVELEMI